MNLFSKYQSIKEGRGDTVHTSGNGYTAIVSGHNVTFHKNGEHMEDADYVGKGDTKEEKERDAQEFAHDEMEHRRGVTESIVAVDEHIKPPQGHEDTVSDRIARDSEEGTGHKHKMMLRTSDLTAKIAQMLYGNR